MKSAKFFLGENRFSFPFLTFFIYLFEGRKKKVNADQFKELNQKMKNKKCLQLLNENGNTLCNKCFLMNKK